MLRRMLPLVLVAPLLAGCGAAKSSTDGFTGEDKKVAQVIVDLQAAGESGDAGELCSRILSTRFVDQVSAKGSSCSQELDDAVGDADDFELNVQRVTVKGTTATAIVTDADGRRQTVDLVRESKGWRVSALS